MERTLQGLLKGEVPSLDSRWSQCQVVKLLTEGRCDSLEQLIGNMIPRKFAGRVGFEKPSIHTKQLFTPLRIKLCQSSTLHFTY